MTSARSLFALVFVAVCGLIAATGIALRPAPPLAGPGSAPRTPPTAWPDYRVGGAGFVTPAMPDGDLIAYGYRLIAETYAVIGPEVGDSALRFAGNNLACRNCHLDVGTNRAAMPLVGIVRTFPKFSDRDQRVISLVERINECMTRSMNGHRLPDESREMNGFLAFLRYIGEPEPLHAPPAPEAPLPPDAARGAEVYTNVCAACHGPDGLGKRNGAVGDALGYTFPPLWGPDSFNDGAGMDRYVRIVGFVRRNMPRGVDPQHPVLSLQQAWDVSAYVIARPRPHHDMAR
ncbi:c-type cytochrome [Reyranella sp.]|uniref:c-type cytochrome n=1 Tax=Reyranella sp. TaxID=1929291 RepID=UPI003783BBD8